MASDLDLPDAKITRTLFIRALDHFVPTTHRTAVSNLYSSHYCRARGSSTIQQAGEIEKRGTMRGENGKIGLHERPSQSMTTGYDQQMEPPKAVHVRELSRSKPYCSFRSFEKVKLPASESE